MQEIIRNIKKLMEIYISDLYNDYLKNNNILLIKTIEIKEVITKLYNENSKNIKSYIRNSLKESMKEEYPSGTVENILLDIFQEKETNINRLEKIIIDYQTNNYFEIEKCINDNQLGISIKFDGSFCEIGVVKDNTCDTKNIIEKYNYLYSINDIVINEQINPIEFIKKIITNSDKVNIGLYKLCK